MDKFDIDKFLKNQEGKDYLDILTSCHQEHTWLNNIKPKDRDEQYYWQKYYSFLGGFTFLLSQGIKPASMNDDDFMSIKPIIKSLVDKKQLKPEMLDLFNKP